MSALTWKSYQHCKVRGDDSNKLKQNKIYLFYLVLFVLDRLLITVITA